MLIEVALLMALASPQGHHQVSGYHVKAGDTMSGVAVKRCRSARDWTGIYAASRSRHMTARDANLIVPGQQLAIDCRYLPSQLVHARTLARPAPRHFRDVAYVRPSYHRPRFSGGTSRVSSSMQGCIIARESGGNIRAVNPASGAGGKYQFLPSTWHALGHSGLPEYASESEQDQAFYQEVAQSGYSAWQPYDGC